MSFLYNKNTRKALKWFWGGLAVLIIISMVGFAAPGVFGAF